MIKEEKLMDFERLDLTELDKDLSEEQRTQFTLPIVQGRFLPGEWREWILPALL